MRQSAQPQDTLIAVWCGGCGAIVSAWVVRKASDTITSAADMPDERWMPMLDAHRAQAGHDATVHVGVLSVTAWQYRALAKAIAAGQVPEGYTA